MYSIPLVAVIDRGEHVTYDRSEAQLQDVSWNYRERDGLPVTIAKLGGYRFGAAGTLFVTVR